MEQTSEDVKEAKVAPEILLKQFLYLSNTVGYNMFFTGKPETHKNYDAWSLPFINDLVKSNPNLMLNIIENTNGLNALPNRETIFYVLALITVADTNPALKHHVYRTTLQLIKNDEDFFNYIKFVTKLNKTFSKGINKVIARYYLSKESKQLIKDFGFKNGYHGWTHKDLIKLSHLKSKDLFTNSVIDYVLRGSASAITRANGDKEALSAIEYLDKCKEYRKCTDDVKAAELLSEVNYDITYPPNAMEKPLNVWETLIEHIDLKEVISNLVKFYKLKLLQHQCSFRNKLIEILTNEEKVKESKLQPLDVFMALKIFENGGKPTDPQLLNYLNKLKPVNEKIKRKQNIMTSTLISEPITCFEVSSALNMMLQLSTSNLETTGKRFMINFSVERDINYEVNDIIKCYEAVAIIILPYIIAEKDVVVTEQYNQKCVKFETEFKNFHNVVSSLKKPIANDMEGVFVRDTEFEYAIENKKLVDVFIHINCLPICNIELITESFNKYKETMKMPSAKLVLLSFAVSSKITFDESILFVQGFDTNIPQIINAFIKNLF